MSALISLSLSLSLSAEVYNHHHHNHLAARMRIEFLASDTLFSFVVDI